MRTIIAYSLNFLYTKLVNMYYILCVMNVRVYDVYVSLKISQHQRLVVHNDLWNLSKNKFTELRDHLIFMSIFLYIFIFLWSA